MINTIYILKNKCNNKVYIGQTWDTLKYRWRYSHGYKNCIHLFNAIKKYGKENFYYEVLTFCGTQDAADYWETYFIKLYNSTINGYNLMNGRSNGKHSKETKDKISVAKIGTIVSEETRKNMSKAQMGRKHTVETKNKLSQIKSGKIPYKMTDKTREKLSTLNAGEGNSFFGKHHSDESKKKQSDNKKSMSDEIEKEICNLYLEGYSLNDLSVKFLRSIDTVRRCLIRNDITRRPTGSINIKNNWK